MFILIQNPDNKSIIEFRKGKKSISVRDSEKGTKGGLILRHSFKMIFSEISCSETTFFIFIPLPKDGC